MVDVLNQVGVDWAVLGNHEFDLSEAAFRARLRRAGSRYAGAGHRPRARTQKLVSAPRIEFHANRESRSERAQRCDRDGDVRGCEDSAQRDGAVRRTRPEYSDGRKDRRPGTEMDIVRLRWIGKGGFEPARVVARVTESLDGRESAVRNQQGRLTDLITGAFDREAGGVDVAILNGGSVRVDDVVQAGPVTEYDVLRILPFGGRIVHASVDGELLRAVLDAGLANRATAVSFTHEVRPMIAGQRLDVSARYTVAMTDFLMSGGDSNLGFLTADKSRRARRSGFARRSSGIDR
jgi:2',3'-cyclic-nucleotide 2'-phosphodiesterase (5'-nucleotidase family)